MFSTWQTALDHCRHNRTDSRHLSQPLSFCEGVRGDTWKVSNTPKVISIQGDRVKVHTRVHAIPQSLFPDTILHCLGGLRGRGERTRNCTVNHRATSPCVLKGPAQTCRGIFQAKKGNWPSSNKPHTAVRQLCQRREVSERCLAWSHVPLFHLGFLQETRSQADERMSR